MYYVDIGIVFQIFMLKLNGHIQEGKVAARTYDVEGAERENSWLMWVDLNGFGV